MSAKRIALKVTNEAPAGRDPTFYFWAGNFDAFIVTRDSSGLYHGWVLLDNQAGTYERFASADGALRFIRRLGYTYTI